MLSKTFFIIEDIVKITIKSYAIPSFQGYTNNHDAFLGSSPQFY